MSDIKHTGGTRFALRNTDNGALYVAHNGHEGQRLMDRDSDGVFVALERSTGISAYTISYEEAEKLSKHLGQLCQERRRDLLESEKRKRQEKERQLRACSLDAHGAMHAMLAGQRIVPFNERDNRKPPFYFFGANGQVMFKPENMPPQVAERGPVSINPWDTQWVTESLWLDYQRVPKASSTVTETTASF